MSSKPNDALSHEILVYCDGACKGNPGPGGWGAVVLVGGREGTVQEFGGGEQLTTNNIMELVGATRGLEAAECALLKNRPRSTAQIRQVRVFCDSKYVIQGASQWRHGWKKSNWVKQDGTPVANLRYWQELDALCDRLALRTKVEWVYVEGHAGIPGNERCDEIAQGIALGRSVTLYSGRYGDYGIDLFEPLTVNRKPQTDIETESGSGTGKKKYPLYLSYINGELREHASWPECQAVVNGRSGAKYKKVTSAGEYQKTLASWGI